MNLNNISQFYTKQLFYDLELCVILNTWWLFRCMLDIFVMMAKLLTYECKALPANNIVLFTVRVCTDLIHWLLHLCCRNWGLPSWQNWFREGSQGANDTWNDYCEKEIKCPYSSETSLSTTCSAAFGQGLRATAGGDFDSSRYERLLDTKIDKLQGEMRWFLGKQAVSWVVQKGRLVLSGNQNQL